MARQAQKLRTQVEGLLEQLPDKEELAGLRDELGAQIADRLPSKKELLTMRNSLIDQLPDTMSDKLPVVQKQKKKRSMIKTILFAGISAASIGAAVAYQKAKAADHGSYSPPASPPPVQNVAPGAPGSPVPPADVPPTTGYSAPPTPDLKD